jgi:hypothetical protein
MAVWLVADFEALSYQVTSTFDTGCAARIRTAPAINYSTYDKSIVSGALSIIMINYCTKTVYTRDYANTNYKKN